MVANVITLVLFFALSWWFYRGWILGRYQHCLYATLLLSFLIHANGIFYFYLNPWDEAFHAVVAKNIASHPLKPTLYDDAAITFPPQDWVKSHIWLHKPPLTLWFMALSMKIFGDSEISIRIPSLIFSCLSVFLTYLIGRHLLSAKIAVIACYFHAINGMLFDLSRGWHFSDHIDTLLILLVQAGVCIAALLLPMASKALKNSGNLHLEEPFDGEKPQDLLKNESENPKYRPSLFVGAILSGVFVGMGFLTKLFPAFLPWVLFCYTLYILKRSVGESLKYLMLSILVAAVFIVPWNLYAYLQWPEWFLAGITGKLFYITQPVDNWGGGFFYHWIRIPRYFGELSVVSILFVFYRAFTSKSIPLRFLCLWVLFPYLVFSATTTKAPAYPLIAAPAIFLINAYFVHQLYEMRLRLASGFKKKFLVIFLITFIVLTIRGSLERQKLHKNRPREKVSVERVKDYCQKINKESEKTVIFGMPAPGSMFYCDAPVYYELPDQETIKSLESRGYRVLIYSDKQS
jgi:hypothetical protein